MTHYNKLASNLLRAELTRRGISFEDLQARLAKLENSEPLTVNAIKIKISRGTFSFAFFLQVMEVIDANVLRIKEE